jgi:glucans biosynthesis protein
MMSMSSAARAASVLLCVASARALGFGFEDVVARAQEAAARPYVEPRRVPPALGDIGYDQYRGIRYLQDNYLWADEGSHFQLAPVMPGGVYRHLVPINIVAGEAVERLAFHKEYFKYDEPELLQQIPDDLDYAGFELSYPLTSRDVQEKFLVFAGASYFRGVGKGGQWGLSARGAAIDCGLDEEFPDFVEYWLVKPPRDARTMTFFALLDSPRLTGAYQYVVTPGDALDVDVRSVLFTRASIQLLGVAPLTSMYWYGENTARPSGAWRPEVHDSDGLLVRNDGEPLWRPLVTPRGIRIDYFPVPDLQWFGLMQRDTAYSSYEDVGTRYDLRPSAIVTPRSGMKGGRTVLVRLPTNNEYLDNIVAFWSPAGPVEPNARLELNYDMRFGPSTIAPSDRATVAHTFVGHDLIAAHEKIGSYRLIVDFSGGRLARLPKTAPVLPSIALLEEGDIVEYQLERMEANGDWRLSILAKPAKDGPLALRASLVMNGEPLTEVWDYALEPNAE